MTFSLSQGVFDMLVQFDRPEFASNPTFMEQAATVRSKTVVPGVCDFVLDDHSLSPDVLHIHS